MEIKGCALVMVELRVELQEEKIMRKYLQSILESGDCAPMQRLCSKRNPKLEARTPRKVPVTLVRRGARAEPHGLGRAADATSRRTRLAVPELQRSRATKTLLFLSNLPVSTTGHSPLHAGETCGDKQCVPFDFARSEATQHRLPESPYSDTACQSVSYEEASTVWTAYGGFLVMAGGRGCMARRRMSRTELRRPHPV